MQPVTVSDAVKYETRMFCKNWRTGDISPYYI